METCVDILLIMFCNTFIQILCSEYENAYSYTTDDWPSITDSINDRTLSQPQSPVGTRRRPRPFKAIRRVAGRFVDGVVRFPHSQ